MIRSKTQNFLHQKYSTKGRSFNPNKDILIHQPWWFEQYYQHKETLEIVNQKNKQIDLMTRQYEVNPSAYSLMQVEKIIGENCRMIEEIFRWIEGFKYNVKGSASEKVQRNLIAYLKSTLTNQSNQTSLNQLKLQQVNGQLNNITRMPNISHISMQDNRHQQDYNQRLQQMTTRIEQLNRLIKRMNSVVIEQGNLVDRIDQNLFQGRDNMKKANEQLEKRVRKEQGTGEFSWEGKINKTITSLYFVNLGLIGLFLLKHLIF